MSISSASSGVIKMSNSVDLISSNYNINRPGFSVEAANSQFNFRSSRSNSAGCYLLVPSERYGSKRVSDGQQNKTKEVLFEDESDVIRNCGALSSAVLGLMKSFSTSDISTTNLDADVFQGQVRQTQSELALFGGIVWNPKLDLPNIRRLDCTSRSCSTWVAVGDPISSTSQLPSPQGQSSTSPIMDSQAITAIDFVRSVNKKVRQMYIRQRLLSTYRALERLSRSQVDLSHVVKGDVDLSGFISSKTAKPLKSQKTSLTESVRYPHVQISTSDFNLGLLMSQIDISTKPTQTLQQRQVLADSVENIKSPAINKKSLTAKDIELQKGKPLTKYERNIMIFNWLQNLDEGGLEQMGST